MSCESCMDEARERMRDLDNIKQKARMHAKEQGKAMAICKEATGGYFIIEAAEAVNNACMIIEIVSGV